MAPIRILSTSLSGLLLIVVSGTPILPAQAPELKELGSFNTSRALPPGPTRIAAAEAFSRVAGARSYAILASALEKNASQFEKLEVQIEGLDKEAAAKQALATKASASGEPSAESGALDALEKARGDLAFRHAQLTDLEKENAFLRSGVLLALKKTEEPERTARLNDLRNRALRPGPSSLKKEQLRIAGNFPTGETAEWLGRILQTEKDASLRAAAAELLAIESMPGAESRLTKALSDPSVHVRSTILRGLRVHGRAEGVEALIQRIPLESGRLLEETVAVLRFLAGVNYFDNVELWTSWWQKEKPRFATRDARPRSQRVEDPNEGLPRGGNDKDFYGLRPASRALAFLIDISGSMDEPAGAEGTTGSSERNETKLKRAQRELIRTINGLPSGISLNVVAYGDELSLFSKTMVTLNDTTRRSLVAWVKSLRAKGQTNLYDALDWCLETAHGKRSVSAGALPVDTVYLLSDGRPTAGRMIDSAQIAADIARRNAAIGLVIHCIGVGTDHDASLLKDLSEQSRGVYLPAR